MAGNLADINIAHIAYADLPMALLSSATPRRGARCIPPSQRQPFFPAARLNFFAKDAFLAEFAYWSQLCALSTA